MDAYMIVAGAIACLGLSAAGSAFGTGFAASAAVGAWKKCYAANKPAPFLLLSFVGAPITQTLYGMILMFIMLGKVEFIENAEGIVTGIKPLVASGAGLPVLIAGIFAGLGIGLSALFQGRAGAGACDAQAETNQGFTNYLAALGIVETVAIFTMVFALIALGKIA
ncbi:MAG: V-type ATP synthase subunit K [Kiritimatiellae bacterium]|jgi:V/A-type H+-transporting ATPase subunit K|nr:V-type ATP synthase subunit K [Kiritimatiellia bacterium]